MLVLPLHSNLIIRRWIILNLMTGVLNLKYRIKLLDVWTQLFTTVTMKRQFRGRSSEGMWNYILPLNDLFSPSPASSCCLNTRLDLIYQQNYSPLFGISAKEYIYKKFHWLLDFIQLFRHRNHFFLNFILSLLNWQHSSTERLLLI